MSIRTFGTWMTALWAMGAMSTGCGDDSGGVGGSYDSLVGAIESPTGTVDMSTTPDVVEGLDEALSSSDTPTPFSTDLGIAKQDVGAAYCTSGGIGVEGASENGATVNYNDCCIQGCCISGRASVFISQGGAYGTCTSYDLSTRCDGESAVSTVSNVCTNSDGGIVYAIEVEGESFAVSIAGSYSEGTGTLEITGANGSVTCTLTDYSGDCEGDAGTFSI